MVLSGGELTVVALDPGDTFALPGDELAHVYLVSGSAGLADGLRLGAGDALRLRGAAGELVAETHSRLLAWTLRKG